MPTEIDWPSWCYPERVEIELVRPSQHHRSEITRQAQKIFMGVEYWRLVASFRAEGPEFAARREALVNALAGGDTLIRTHHFARPVPKGTMRGSPVLAANVGQFARSLSLAGVFGVGRRWELNGALDGWEIYAGNPVYGTWVAGASSATGTLGRPLWAVACLASGLV
jgi:hypothetical protein